jgi:hypothetical protein
MLPLEIGGPMVKNHYKPGKFRARLTVRGVPRASHYDYEVGEAASPEAALEIAMLHWRSAAWPGPIESANFAEVFRYEENGALQTESSFNFPFKRL